jgi:CRP/FNR family transcriptional regulator
VNDPQFGGRTLNAGNSETIYQPEDPAAHFYFIRRGQVRLYTVSADGSTRLVEILGPGNWFGAASLARGTTYRMRAVSVGGSMISEISAEQLFTALSKDPLALVELARQLAGKLMTAHEEASRLVFEDCQQRLVSALLRFSRSAASTPSEDGVVLRITHEQLAQAVGVARETVSLALTQLRQQNLLHTGRNQLMFNPEALRSAAGQFRSAPNPAREREAAGVV